MFAPKVSLTHSDFFIEFQYKGNSNIFVVERNIEQSVFVKDKQF